MHEIDRGIIKWLPFDALSGYKEAIKMLKEKRNKIVKPILSEDQIAELNYELTTALNLRKNIEIYYYSKGNIYYVVGFITNIDMMNKQIKLENKWIKEEMILKLSIFN